MENRWRCIVPDRLLVDEAKVKDLVARGELVKCLGNVKRMLFDGRCANSAYVDVLVQDGEALSFERESLARKWYGKGVFVNFESGLTARQEFLFSVIGFGDDDFGEVVLVAPSTLGRRISGKVLYYEAGPEFCGVVDFQQRLVYEQSKFWKSDRWCTYGPEDIEMLCLLDEVALCQMHALIYMIHRSEIKQVV